MITLWIGAAIGAGMKIAGSIAGGISGKKQAAASQAELDRQRRKNEDWYNRNYNADATQRADAQRMLSKTEELIKQRNQAAAGSQAVMGGTSESVAAAKAANNKTISDATSNIVANADARKDAIEATYMQNEANFSQQQRDIYNAKAQATADAVKGVFDAGASIAGSVMGKKDDPESTTNQSQE